MIEQISIRKLALNQRNLTLRSEVAQLDASEEQYKTQKQEIEETIEKLILQGNRFEDQIKKYLAEISRATKQFENEKTAYHREASRL